jgi:hypothetical protein
MLHHKGFTRKVLENERTESVLKGMSAYADDLAKAHEFSANDIAVGRGFSHSMAYR